MTYLYILISIIIFPLAIGLTQGFRFYFNRKLVKTLFFTATPFLIWDWWATTQGHWSFNPAHTIGITFFNLPIEEIAFFFVAPFACLFLYAASEKYIQVKYLSLPFFFWVLTIGASLLLLIVGFPKPYSTIVYGLSVLLLLYSYQKFRFQITTHMFLYFFLSFIFFIIFNSVLTMVPIVSYAPWAILNLRVGTIPIEDFWYNFLLLSFTLIIYKVMSNKHTNAQAVFQKGSTTYYTASQFFSPNIREKVTTLYAFVRLADNYVDQLPEKRKELETFIAEYHEEVLSPGKARQVISNFVLLMKNTGIKPAWVEAFLDSMIQDITKKTYANFSDLSKYIYGSAEVIGLMMSRIFGLSSIHDPAAAKLGKAMQYCNMLRDIDEDLHLGRVYLPLSVLQKFKLEPFSKLLAQKKPKQFRLLMQQELSRCLQWFNEAEKDISAIPRRERVAVKTASAMYRWTAEQLYKNPQLVFQKKLKPSKFRVLLTAISYSITG
ncbi:lycopene cyclase domain-containing protein [Candidatus Woesebacteria bacterium]|nr:lycopene cyclase domain-containing protein [Candidatus Woesebacteria bacterium]